jgi:5-methylthioadenosine/S-adenosylhomocysteine deaminase
MDAPILLAPRWLVPIEPDGAVLEGHAVVIRGERIEMVAPAHEAAALYPGAEHVTLGDHALIPGLVNAHTHAAMTLIRGFAGGEHLWPAERKHVSAEFVRDGTLLACAEMLRGGTTCFNDMYFFAEAAIEAVLASGMRAALGIIVIEQPSAYAADADDYLHKGLALRDQYRDHPSLSFCIAPHAPHAVSDASLRKVARLAAELDVPVHMHVQETGEEIARSVSEHGVRPIERLRRLGLLGPGLIAVHAVHLDETEIALLGRHGCSVAHCPSSNLRLASGFAPVAALARAGVNLALGTEGAACSHRLDMFQEMRLAALLAKAVARDAGALPAHAALRAATLGGATALGIDARTGSIAAGKLADLVAVEIVGPALSPRCDPASHLVYAAGRENVTHVWVGGKPLVREGKLHEAAFAGLDTRSELWQNASPTRAES